MPLYLADEQWLRGERIVPKLCLKKQNKQTKKNMNVGAREIAQKLVALAAFPEDLSLSLSTLISCVITAPPALRYVPDS